MRQKR